MSHLKYYNYKSARREEQKSYSYSQAVRVGDRIEIAGQGGWDVTTGAISPSPTAQIDQAFSNVDLALKTAGGKGWSQVFRVNSYHVPLDDEAMVAMERNLKAWCPGHRPIWTCVGVEALGLGEMKAEVEVVAVDGEGEGGKKEDRGW